MRAQIWTSIVAGAALLASCHPAPAASDAPFARAAPAPARELSPSARLSRANQRLEFSAYKQAEAEFRALISGAEASPARIGLGQVLLKTGRAVEAMTTLAPSLSDAKWGTLAALYTARAQQSLGRLGDAEATLRAVKAERVSFALQLELGSLLLQAGRRADAEPVLMTIVQAYNDDRIQDSDGAGMALVGRAAQLLRSPKDANDAYDAAERALPGDTRLWAALQDVSGGTWGGAVYDVDAILRVLAAGKRALGEA